MFNPLTPAEVTTAMGRAARDAARSDDPADAFVRAQLLSVYSASRHLGVELTAFEPELRGFAAAVADAVSAAGPGDDRWAAIAAELAATAEAREMGDLVCRLLDALRADAGQQAAGLRGVVRARLAELAGREVDLLAAVIEGGARR
jgi:hypothetical protein